LDGKWDIKTTAQARIAFIGGSGLYRMDGLEHAREVSVDTPFGAPSDAIMVGSVEDTAVAFLPRHGRGHRLSPSEIPARANIYALKTLGVERIISVSAVGSLQEQIKPLDMLIPDQLIDRTRSRVSTFFEGGIVAHVTFSDPFCPVLREALAAAADQSVTVHRGGTYVVMEGPQFSTRAESELYRSWGASIIGMTALPEAKLAREAEICYATIALVTDYDCWHETEDDVTIELVIANLNKNTEVSQRVLRDVLPAISGNRRCDCGSALENAIITSPEHIGDDTRTRLSALLGKHRDPMAASAS
jgi:5'-methylthioadenosine phosphorylase